MTLTTSRCPYGLLSPAFAATRRCLIHSTPLPSPQPAGRPHPPYAECSATAPSARDIQASAVSPDQHHTNNTGPVEKWGNIVAYTNTINLSRRQRRTAPGYGFLLTTR